jgi:hypothetical protein
MVDLETVHDLWESVERKLIGWRAQSACGQDAGRLG